VKVATLPLFQDGDAEEFVQFGSDVPLEAMVDAPGPDGLVRGRPFRFLSSGEVNALDGRRVKCTPEDFAAVLKKLAKQTVPVPLTLEHDDALGRMGEAPAPSIAHGNDGLWCMSPLWTQEAVDQIKTGKRTFPSATFFVKTDAEGWKHPIGIRDIALVSVPNDGNVGRIALSALNQATHSPAKASERKEQDMKLSAENAKLLGLAENASDEDFNKTLGEKMAAKAPPETPILDFKAEVAKAVETIRAEAMAATKTIVENTLAAKDVEAKALELVEQAAKDGKVVPAQREHALTLAKASPEAFKSLIANAPRVAPTVQVVTPSRDIPINTDQNDKLTKVAQFATQRGISMTQAEAHLKAVGVIG
jgi:hypothetical protein